MASHLRRRQPWHRLPWEPRIAIYATASINISIEEHKPYLSDFYSYMPPVDLRWVRHCRVWCVCNVISHFHIIYALKFHWEMCFSSLAVYRMYTYIGFDCKGRLLCTHQLWRCRQYIPPKCRYSPTRLHLVTTQMFAIWIIQLVY
jgi:hypothetical protein